jgi:hypothetical protein
MNEWDFTVALNYLCARIAVLRELRLPQEMSIATGAAAKFI